MWCNRAVESCGEKEWRGLLTYTEDDLTNSITPPPLGTKDNFTCADIGKKII